MEETKIRVAIDYKGTRKPKFLSTTLEERELIIECLELFQLDVNHWKNFELRISLLDCLVQHSNSLLANDILILANKACLIPQLFKENKERI